MVSTTRPINCRTEDSRWGVPSGPRKYFWATLFEGVAALLVVGNDCVADLPLHLVERVSPLLGEMAPERELARLDPYVLLLRSHLALPLRDPGEGPWTDGLTSPWGQVVENHTGVIRGFSPRQSKLSSASTDIVPHVVGHGPRRRCNHNMLWSKTEPERQSGLGPGSARCGRPLG